MKMDIEKAQKEFIKYTEKYDFSEQTNEKNCDIISPIKYNYIQSAYYKN